MAQFDAMSEFKFACPVCGQHITADSKDTGSQISCPTCFRKIVVPPSSGEAKFVLSASEANKPRPTQTTPPPMEGMERQPAKTPISIALIVLVVLACGAGATVFALRGRFHSKPGSGSTGANAETNQTGTAGQPEVVRADYAGSNLWTLDLAEAEIPDMPLAGSLRHEAFTLDRATLTASNLTLRGQMDLSFNIYFFNRQAEELSGKTAEVKPTDTTAPRVVLHWKDQKRESRTFRNGYAMKVEFGPVANGDIPGKLFICLPDESKSWIAGTFNAEIRKPGPPKPKQQSRTQ